MFSDMSSQKQFNLFASKGIFLCHTGGRGKGPSLLYLREQATLASSHLLERGHLVMLKRHIPHFTLPLLILAVLTLTVGTSMLLRGLSVSGQSSQHSLVGHGATTPIQHIVFLIKENSTFYSYLCAFPGASG